MSGTITFADLVKGGYWEAYVSDCQPPRQKRGNPIQNARSIRLTGPHRTEDDAIKAAEAQIKSGWANGHIIIHQESANAHASFVLAQNTVNALGKLRDQLSADLQEKEAGE